MSETLFTFLLSEIKNLRISCQRKFNGADCSGAVEVAVGHLYKVHKCPVCGEDLVTGKESPTPLGVLAHAIENINNLDKSVVKVEIVLPETTQRRQ
jgi:predicted RNA-binding Zn-ribbon protein involved in translation (DUF1610 family)